MKQEKSSFHIMVILFVLQMSPGCSDYLGVSTSVEQTKCEALPPSMLSPWNPSTG